MCNLTVSFSRKFVEVFLFENCYPFVCGVVFFFFLLASNSFVCLRSDFLLFFFFLTVVLEQLGYGSNLKSQVQVLTEISFRLYLLCSS